MPDCQRAGEVILLCLKVKGRNCDRGIVAGESGETLTGNKEGGGEYVGQQPSLKSRARKFLQLVRTGWGESQ